MLHEAFLAPKAEMFTTMLDTSVPSSDWYPEEMLRIHPFLMTRRLNPVSHRQVRSWLRHLLLLYARRPFIPMILFSYLSCVVLYLPEDHSTKSVSAMKNKALSNLLDFDVDRHLNPYIPHSRLHRLPDPLKHFLGHRSRPHQEPPAVLQWLSTAVATMTGMCLVGTIFNYAPGITEYHGPVMLASIGASAVLDYNAMRSPLAQPRNTIIGHTLSAIVGVAISKVFQFSSNFVKLQWLAGAVAAACASVAMSITKTVYPPGGATAVLACTEVAVVGLGWMLVPFVLLASVLTLAVALLFNNVLRQYPLYWWTPDDTGWKLTNAQRGGKHESGTLEKQDSACRTDSECTLRRDVDNCVDSIDETGEVHIMPYKIQMPPHIELTDEEALVLDRIQQRLRMHTDGHG